MLKQTSAYMKVMCAHYLLLSSDLCDLVCVIYCHTVRRGQLISNTDISDYLCTIYSHFHKSMSRALFISWRFHVVRHHQLLLSALRLGVLYCLHSASRISWPGVLLISFPTRSIRIFSATLTINCSLSIISCRLLS